MAYNTGNSMGGMVSDYAKLKTIPALLSVVFIAATLYQFGGIAEIQITWVDYTLTTYHAMLISLGAYVVAFASSETKEFQNYEDWEKAAIAAGPILIIGHQHVTFISELVTGTGAEVIAFFACVAAWGVAVR